jgi:DNA polymerase-3 subunit epsilon/exodeoxyribonuclease X
MDFYRLTYLRYALGIYKYEESEAKKIGIEIKYAHDAVTDILLLKLLFDVLLKKVDKKISKLIELSTKPVLLTKINFGKHNGKTFQDIKAIDKGYWEWLKKNSTDEDIIYTINNI